jgi:hypothetical protein
MTRLLALLFGILWIPSCPAANFSISMDAKKDTSVADPAYPATGSTITSTFDKQSQITVSVAGKNYGTVPLPPPLGARWGLKAEPLPWQTNQDGVVITGGYQPSARGSGLTPLGFDASYITVILTNVQPGTQFQNLSIELSGVTQATTTNAWGAASPGNFSTWVAPALSGGGSKLTFDLPGFTWNSGPLEIRLYGVTAVTEGAFTDFKISGTYLVPEPGTSLLLLVAMGFALNFRSGRVRANG